MSHSSDSTGFQMSDDTPCIDPRLFDVSDCTTADGPAAVDPNNNPVPTEKQPTGLPPMEQVTSHQQELTITDLFLLYQTMQDHLRQLRREMKAR